MKGILLCGGAGTRLQPMTLVINKHLLPVYDKPMCYYPLNTLVQNGITDIMIVTSNEHAGGFIHLLGNGEKVGANLTYRTQTKAGGIAEALGLCESFAGKEPVAVILGDNIFDDIDFSIKNTFKNYTQGAHIFLKSVLEPERFGIATIEDDEIVDITEKPKNPKSNLAVTGLYIYNSSVWHVIRNLKPSKRGELEISDVNRWYLDQRMLQHSILDGYWSDAGTPESLFRTSEYVREQYLLPKTM